MQGNVPLVAAPLPVNDADLVHGRQFLDCQFGDLLLPAVAVGHFAGVHDQRQAALALYLERLDVTIDRKSLLDRRSLPAAGTEAVGAADHDETASLIMRVAANDFLLLVGDHAALLDISLAIRLYIAGRNVRQDQAIVVAEEDCQ